MCPHQHHPSPDVQQLMVPLDAMNHYQQVELTGSYTGTCWLDGFLMWPVPPNTTNCGRQDPHLDLESILGPAPSAAHLLTASLNDPTAAEPHVSHDAAQPSDALLESGGTFCIHHGQRPVTIKPLSRPANVDGYRLPAAEDLEG
jgi:hypothetical protein